MQRQKDQYQGIWIVSPEGKVLAAHHEVKDPKAWSREVLDSIDAARSAAGPIAPRDAPASQPLAHRGVGRSDAGRVSLAVYSRYIRGGGREAAPEAADAESLWMWDGKLAPDGPPVIDTIELSASEWSAFRPPRRTVGTRWTLQESVARQFARVLSPSSDQSTMPHPDEAEVAELSATVESVAGERVRVRLQGKWAATHAYDNKLSHGWSAAEGFAELEGDELESLVLVFHGAWRMPPPYDKGVRPTGAVAEWRAR